MEILTNMEDIHQKINEEFTIIIAKGHTCSVCEPIGETLGFLLKNYNFTNAYAVYIEDVPEFSGQHLVFSVPTIMIFSEGKELHRESRFIDFSKIDRFLKMIA